MDDVDASTRRAQGRLGRKSLGRGEREWLRESWDKLAAMAAGLDLEPPEMRVLELRWLNEARHYDDLWRRQRTMHDVLGVVTIVAGLAAPLLVAIDAADWALALAGFTVAASSSLVGFFRYGERWRHQRKTAMLLKSEGVRFLEMRKPYAAKGSHQSAFPDFIENLERINEAQSEEYLGLWSLAGADSDDVRGVTSEAGER